MKEMNFYKTIVLISFLILSTLSFSQNWETIDESAYNTIIENRFNKGNKTLGIGGSLSMHNDYKVIEFSYRNQFGYFFKDRWLLNASSDLYLAQAKFENNTKAKYNRLLLGIGIRHYFKPKKRTFFIETCPLLGFIKNNAEKIPDYASLNSLVYGGKIVGGISIFVRYIEVELSTGYIIYSPNYKKENIFSENLYQLNLTYIFK